MEKIQSPAPGIYFFYFHNNKGPLQLVMRAERKVPFLFASAERLSVGGKTPTGEVMRLRKYLAGRRVAACMADWPARRLSLLFRAPQPSAKPVNTADLGAGSFAPRPSCAHNHEETWLVLDLREGPTLLQGSSPDIPEPPLWPAPQELTTISGEAFRQWPVLTPALRRVLPCLDEPEQAALINDLAEGGGDLYLYEPDASQQAANACVHGESSCDITLSAWPLPPGLRRGRQEKVFEDPLAASVEAGMKLVMGGLAAVVRKAEAAPLAKAGAKLERILHKLLEEEVRLHAMLARKEEAKLLQDNMWKLGPTLKKSEVTIKNQGSPAQKISLDPKLTVLENMEFLFRQAARGSRGLAFVEQRRAAIIAEMGASGFVAKPVMQEDSEQKNSDSPAPAHIAPKTMPHGVAGIYSSDGRFALWRGKDAKGNAALIKAASPHDVWLHVEGGPGAHVLIRRDHAGQEIPDEIWREAGIMAVEKSWRRDDAKATVICALARHVKSIRGGEPGAARVDKVLKMLHIDMPLVATSQTRP